MPDPDKDKKPKKLPTLLFRTFFGEPKKKAKAVDLTRIEKLIKEIGAELAEADLLVKSFADQARNPTHTSLAGDEQRLQEKRNRLAELEPIVQRIKERHELIYKPELQKIIDEYNRLQEATTQTASFMLARTNTNAGMGVRIRFLAANEKKATELRKLLYVCIDQTSDETLKLELISIARKLETDTKVLQLNASGAGDDRGTIIAKMKAVGVLITAAKNIMQLRMAQESPSVSGASVSDHESNSDQGSTHPKNRS